MKQFYTAPTLIRSLMAAGEQHVTPHDRSSLRVLGTVGEPINPEAWRWYHEVRPIPYTLGTVGKLINSEAWRWYTGS